MTDVWRLPAIAPWEKSCTKQHTQQEKECCVNQTREHIAQYGIHLERILIFHRHGHLSVHKQQVDHRQSEQQQELCVPPSFLYCC